MYNRSGRIPAELSELYKKGRPQGPNKKHKVFSRKKLGLLLEPASLFLLFSSSLPGGMVHLAMKAIATPFSFMLPPGTRHNASVLASGQLTIPQMARAGLGINILSIVIIVALLYFIILSFLNISPSHPAWM